MRSAIEELYGHIFEFFSRAHKWYHEGLARHIWHSFTQPPSLRYEDILEDIDECSRQIDKLAQLGSHVEINRKLTELQTTQAHILAIWNRATATQDQQLADILARVTLISSAQVNTDQRVMDLQCSAILSDLGDGMEFLEYDRSLVSRISRLNANRGFTNRFWHSPKLTQWTTAKDSRVIFIEGNPQAVSVMREFQHLVVDRLQENQVPILWALPNPGIAQGGHGTKGISPIDLLKRLILQAMKLCKQTPNESSMTRLCTQFKTISTEKEWMRMLGSVLKLVGPQCYILIDLTALDEGLRFVDKGFSWLHAFQELFAELARGNLPLQVKVLLTLSSRQGRAMSSSIPPELLVPVREHPIPPRKRKKMEAQFSSRNRARVPYTLPRGRATR